MAIDAASFIDTCAQRRVGGLLDRGELAFCLFKYFPFGGLQRDFVRIARECMNKGYRIRVYTLSWQGEVPKGFEVILVPAVALMNHKRYQLFYEWIMEDLRRRPVRG
ncbi:MAG: hypothetical protein OEZ23_02725, partial [Gammaproteobacteria bacterium]|nr:hypothetical protein [Gammaproteobacteria bacterium]